MQFELREFEDGHREAWITNRTLKDKLLMIFLPRKKAIVFSCPQEEKEDEEKTE